MDAELRASVIIDYQNVHLTGHDLFTSTTNWPRHATLIDPLRFANQLIATRNKRQRPGVGQPAVLRKVLVYRGQPSGEHDPDGYNRSQAQKAQWERDQRVTVTLRPLKYRYQGHVTGRPAHDINGVKIPIGRPQEKGVDVLCALATVREARNPATDLVILATSDSDLAPALDEVRIFGSAKVETFCWYDAQTKTKFQLHPTDRSRPLWNTQLGEMEFRASWDPTRY